MENSYLEILPPFSAVGFLAKKRVTEFILPYKLTWVPQKTGPQKEIPAKKRVVSCGV